MPDLTPDMFTLEGDKRVDSYHHAPILASVAGNVALELSVIDEAIAEGMDPEEAMNLYAGADTLKYIAAGRP